MAVNDYHLKEIIYDDLGKLKYIDRGAYGNVFCTSCKSIQCEKIAAKEIYIPENAVEKQIKMFLNE
ncbi:19194_t:CDS:1, partial [Cetraspora pellucida]